MDRKRPDIDEFDLLNRRREAYYSLGNELTAGGPFNENDWDPDFLRWASDYAQDHDLPFPPPPRATGIEMQIWSLGEGKDE